VVTRLLAALAAFIALTAGGASAERRFIPLLGSGDAIPPIPLIAQDGRRFTLADLHGEAVAISFIYTRCGDARMCPLVAAKFGRAQRALGRAPIRLLVVTLDPTFDTPAVLTRYGQKFGQDPRVWMLATGSPQLIDEFTARLGIDSQVTGPGSIVHTEALVIVAPDGRIARTIYGDDWSVDDLVAAARATLPGETGVLGGLRAWLSAAMERCGAAVPALNGVGMLVVLAIALAASGGAFWFAFRHPARGDPS
jgi:protein SCO1/2